MKKIRNIITILSFLIILVIVFYWLTSDSKSKILNNVNLSSNFIDFRSNIVQSDKNILLGNISTQKYDDRFHYDLFNDLYFKFHEKDSTQTWKCINNKETSECLFYNAILNNDENLCNELPEVRSVSNPGKYGTSYIDQYYKLSCILNTKMLSNYNKELDKIAFCREFKEEYIQNQCLVYTCESYYWNKNKPDECKK